MTTRTAAGLGFLGLLMVFGAVGGMEDPLKADYFWEQCLVALVGLAMMFSATLALNNSNDYDER